MEMPIFTLANINKHFGGIAAVTNMSFEVCAGEALGLMGPNGAGKSTLMNLISGQYKPDSGVIQYKGRNITGMPQDTICHLGIARTYQIPQPFVNMTALENVMIAAQYGKGLSKAASEGEAKKVLDMMGLTEKADTLTSKLASITLKRLELARALATDPQLVLLDEVAAGLTETEIPPMLEILGRIREKGITYILIEHVMRVMVKAVDRIVVMDKGLKLAEGLPEEIMKNPKVIEAYLGVSA